MSLSVRNNINILGQGDTTIVFAHGFGCDQSMWQALIPAFEQDYRIILFDLVGSGGSDLLAYDRERYSTLQAHADDLVQLIQAYASAPVVVVGHSVSAIIGLLAGIRHPELMRANIMVAPSPCYLNDGDYHGGFSAADIDELFSTIESNYLGWSRHMAPVIMGAPQQPELGVELTNSFCRTDPDIAIHFAKVTFLSDHRRDLALSSVPSLILQCSDDMIAPTAVGDYMQRHMQHASLAVIDNVGHCPHLSSPDQTIAAIRRYLSELA